MQEYSVKVTLPDGQVMAVTASDSDTLEAVADRFKDYYEDDIILGIVNGRLRELNKKIKSDCELSFVTTADRDGRRTYKCCAAFAEGYIRCIWQYDTASCDAFARRRLLLSA